MRQLVPAALLSLVIGGGAAYVISNRGETTLQTELEDERERVALLTGALAEYLASDEKVAYILINKGAEAGKCKATTTPNVKVLAGWRLKWNFNVVDPSCLENGERVQIRFKATAPTETPDPISEPGKKFISAKLKDIFVGTTFHSYGVWMVPPEPAKPYLMEDPELEIIGMAFIKDFLLKNPVPQTTPIAQPLTAPSNTSPQTGPPAKKQQ